ncbi:hypothetical protein BTJ39_16875 [Izhakiella australiensis]|uniref:Flagellin N-terminal domain-containing protein n=1 Tax=Izhakiella australiensis TaxID=1926881 RepID=A0A1S8YIM9_9GAMM|nr:hypothetical protein [Izhakiella australiensis]OON38762.1 hypothetical protein BTJ39_16875 [Izhakiella australiensis]
MRFPNQLLFNTLQQSYASRNTHMNKLFNQLEQHKRILVPSDDPIASAQVLLLRRGIADADRYQSNIDNLSSHLSQQEIQVSGSNEQLLAILNSLREANNSALSSADMNGYAVSIRANISALVGMANSSDENGSYFFSGTLTDKVPLVRGSDGKWLFQGNHNSAATPVGSSNSVENSVDLVSVLGSDVSVLNNLEDLLSKMDDPALNASSYLSDISSMIEQVNGAFSDSASILTELGTRQNILTQMDEAHEDNLTINQTMVDDLEGLNYPAAQMELQKYMMATQMSLKNFVRILNLSPFAQG